MCVCIWGGDIEKFAVGHVTASLTLAILSLCCDWLWPVEGDRVSINIHTSVLGIKNFQFLNPSHLEKKGLKIYW